MILRSLSRAKVLQVVQGEIVVWLKHPVPDNGGGGGGGGGGGEGGGQSKASKTARIRAAVERVNGHRQKNEMNKNGIEVDECQLSKRKGENGEPYVFTVNRMTGQLFEVKLHPTYLSQV